VTRESAQDGSLAVGVLGCALAVTVLLGIVAVDVGAYLRALQRAQHAADAAALAAAVVADGRVPAPSGVARDPTTEARAVAAAGGAALEACRCPRGRGARVTVTVSVPVQTVVLARLGPRRVVATARAGLVPLSP
jgi:hypothetical protein